MNRKEIKEEAKKKIKGNIWNILWPVLVIGVVEYIIERIFNLTPKVDYTNLESLTATTKMSPTATIITIILTLIITIVMVGYKKYILNFVRTGKFDTKEILNCVKEKWLNIIVATLLVGLIVYVCTLLFVIPGIIMALAYGMVTYIIIDTDLSGVDSLYSIVQMPSGIPVATVAIDGAKNAGILAATILATSNDELRNKIIDYKKSMETAVLEKNEKLQKIGYKEYLASM